MQSTSTTVHTVQIPRKLFILGSCGVFATLMILVGVIASLLSNNQGATTGTESGAVQAPVSQTEGSSPVAVAESGFDDGTYIFKTKGQSLSGGDVRQAFESNNAISFLPQDYQGKAEVYVPVTDTQVSLIPIETFGGNEQGCLGTLQKVSLSQGAQDASFYSPMGEDEKGNYVYSVIPVDDRVMGRNGDTFSFGSAQYSVVDTGVAMSVQIDGALYIVPTDGLARSCGG